MTRHYPDAWLQTFTGRQFWPLEPDPADVCIEDIAHALSMLCRYGGHSLRFFSVAEHSVLVATQTGLHGLLHDAAEAYVLDLPRPLKLMLPDYWTIEDRVLLAIYDGLGIASPTEEEHALVKRADNAVLATEKLTLHHDLRKWALTEEPYANMKIEGWPPAKAERKFLSMWKSLAHPIKEQRR